MIRRSIALSLLVGVLLLAGCAGAATQGPIVEGGTDGAVEFPRTNERDPTPEDYPPAPEALSAETAGEYATAYEEVRMHNELLGTVEASITDLGTSCSATAVDSDGAGYRVTVECGHWYEFESGTSRGIADGAPYETTYLVSDGGITQVEEPRPVY